MTAGTYTIACGPYFYVGSSSNLSKRNADHQWRLKKGTHPNPKLQAAYAEHGSATLTTHIEHKIGLHETEKAFRLRLRKAEQALLDEHAGSAFLCNQSLNANGPDVWAGAAAAVKAKWTDPEYRHRMTEAARNRITTQETRTKQAAAKTGVNNPRSKPVIVTHPDGATTTYPCAREAAKFFRVSQQLMDQWLKGITAWPGTGRAPKEANRWIIPYSAAFAPNPRARRTLSTVGGDLPEIAATCRTE
jgi:hypothetical protein